MYEVDFKIAVNQADGSREVTWLLYNISEQLGYTPVVLGTLGAVAYNQSGGAGTANGTIRFAIEAKGSEVLSVDSATNHSYVWSGATTEPTVNYLLPNGTAGSAVFSTALQTYLRTFTAWAYTDDSGAAQTANLSSATVTAFTF